jgi:type II secretory ATPase GspE/PulE/Tfp pilus assembly ATPase PilB-like protein
LPDLSEMRMYISPIYLVVYAAAIIVWLWIIPKVNDDMIRVRLKTRTFWSGLIVLAGLAGVVFWVVHPNFFAGLAAFVGGVVVVLCCYVVGRNARVEASQRISVLSWVFSSRSGGKRLDIETKLRIYNSDGAAVQMSDDARHDAQGVRRYNLAQTALYEMVIGQASEVDICPEEKTARVRYVVDGVACGRDALKAKDSEAIAQFLMQQAGMDSSITDRSQRGKISLDVAGNKVNLQVTITPTDQGHRIGIGVIDKLIQTDIEALGLEPDTKDALLEIMKTPGILIVSGPAKSGLTSTLYSLLRKQDAYMQSIMTVEQDSPVEIENVTQTHYESADAISGRVASALRQDCDVLMVDQCLDAKTAGLLCEAASEKRILLGAKADEALVALGRWAQLVGDVGRAVEHLDGVFCQRLIRTLCPSCKKSYSPDETARQKLGLGEGKVTFAKSPADTAPGEKPKRVSCTTCAGMGYCGRSAISELLDLRNGLREVVAGRGGAKEIRAAAQEANMKTLLQRGVEKMSSTQTSLAEVTRVLLKK